METKRNKLVQPTLQAHCQSLTSQRYNQSFDKELASQRTERNCFNKFTDT